MAGVGFSLKTLRSEPGYTGLVRLYGAAGLISSGPWLLSISTLLFVGVLGRRLTPDPAALERFQVSVTWLFAASLLWTGPLQLMFTRFTADRDYSGEGDQTLPNLIGACTLCAVSSAAFSGVAWHFFASESTLYKLSLACGFVVLCQVWLVVIVLTGLRAHREVLACFILGYAVTFGACLTFARHGEAGLIAGFTLGQGALLFASLGVLYQRMPAGGDVAYAFLERRALRLDLALIGLLYNAGVWIDKLIFWWNPSTSRQVVGPFCSSEVYDLPIFLAYLTIVPGMAVFLVRVETDFAERHAAFYAAVRGGAPLLRLEALREELTAAGRRAIVDIVRVQGITLLITCLLGRTLLRLCGISSLHLPLFYIDATGVALQVVLLAVTSMFFYLDQRRAVLGLTTLLVLSNALLTWFTQWLGPDFYGYGFAISMAVTGLLGLKQLDRAFGDLVRDTFMLQPVVSP
jgi:uncharacterized membrane protein